LPAGSVAPQPQQAVMTVPPGPDSLPALGGKPVPPTRHGLSERQACDPAHTSRLQAGHSPSAQTWGQGASKLGPAEEAPHPQSNMTHMQVAGYSTRLAEMAAPLLSSSTAAFAPPLPARGSHSTVSGEERCSTNLDMEQNNENEMMAAGRIQRQPASRHPGSGSGCTQAPLALSADTARPPGHPEPAAAPIAPPCASCGEQPEDKLLKTEPASIMAGGPGSEAVESSR
jgi:hypothetical protein